MNFFLKAIKKEIKNADNVTLNNHDILFYGSNRVCYLYPSNPSKLIKIARHPQNWSKDHSQSFLEWYVCKRIIAGAIDCQIALCRSWVNTNKGPGLVVDRVVNNQGRSFTLRNLLFNKEITVEHALALVEEIVLNFYTIGIPASDFNIDNFVFKEDSANKIIMVDGFSPKKPTFKTCFIISSKKLSNHYTKRKWKQAKSRFIYCAQKVYAGEYSFAAATPLHETSPEFTDDTLQ